MTPYKQDEYFSKHLSNDDLLKYHRGLFSDEEHGILENHIKQCELCSDALKGIAEMNNALHSYTITHELRKRMHRKLKPKRTIFSRFDILSLLLIFFIIGLIIFLTFYFLILKW